jgi:hypothetical protein
MRTLPAFGLIYEGVIGHWSAKKDDISLLTSARTPLHYTRLSAYVGYGQHALASHKLEELVDRLS